MCGPREVSQQGLDLDPVRGWEVGLPAVPPAQGQCCLPPPSFSLPADRPTAASSTLSPAEAPQQGRSDTAGIPSPSSLLLPSAPPDSPTHPVYSQLRLLVPAGPAASERAGSPFSFRPHLRYPCPGEERVSLGPNPAPSPQSTQCWLACLCLLGHYQVKAPGRAGDVGRALKPKWGHGKT